MCLHQFEGHYAFDKLTYGSCRREGEILFLPRFLLTAEAFLLHNSPFPAKLNHWISSLSIYRIWMFTPNYGKTARLKCLEVSMNKNGRLTCTKILAGDIGLRYCLLTSWLIMCWEKWAKRPRVNKRTWRKGKSPTRRRKNLTLFWEELSHHES